MLSDKPESPEATKASLLAGKSTPDTPAVDGLIVAHIRDAKTGDISLYVDEREVAYRDLSLVQQLIRATHP
jgi:hypothetical protein